MNKELLELLPTDLELAQISQRLNIALTSRTELLAHIDKLKLSTMELEEKMVYVIGLISLGFDEIRSRERLGITNPEMYIWKQNPEHERMLRGAVSRGEMILEEKVLVEADKNPEMAFKLLERKNRNRERKEDKEQEEKKSVMDFLNKGAKDRGLVIDAKLVDTTLD